MRWLIDEGLPKAVVDWLIEQGNDVLDVAASPLRGAEDDQLWKIAGKQGRLLMTRDVGFMLPEVGPRPLGVVLLRMPDTYKAHHIVRLVQDGLIRIPETKLYSHVTVIEPGRVRQRKLADVIKRKSRV